MNTLYAYNVYLKNWCGNYDQIDTVFYNTKENTEDVKRTLVNHDGYDPNIVVRLERKEKGSK